MKLQMKSKLFSIHSKMELLDENEDVAYTVSSKVITVHNTTFVKNAQGEDIATITRKMLTLHEAHHIEMSSGQSFDLKENMLHITKDVITIDQLGWQLRGDFLEHNYVMEDASGNLLA